MSAPVRLSGLIQGLGNVAIVLGLAIVVYELVQAHNLTYAQILTDEMGKFDDRDLTAMGEDPRPALYRAWECPDALTDLDAVTHDAYYNSMVRNWFRLSRVSEITGIERPWLRAVQNQTRSTFTSEPGRRWFADYNSRQNFLAPEIVGVANEVIRDQPSGAPGNHAFHAILGEAANGSACLRSQS